MEIVFNSTTYGLRNFLYVEASSFQVHTFAGGRVREHARDRSGRRPRTTSSGTWHGEPERGRGRSRCVAPCRVGVGYFLVPIRTQNLAFQSSINDMVKELTARLVLDQGPQDLEDHRGFEAFLYAYFRACFCVTICSHLSSLMFC